MTRKTECVMWEVRDMIETAMAMIEDGFKSGEPHERARFIEPATESKDCRR